MPQYKAIRGIIITEEPLIKTTTNKIKRQANLDIINQQIEKEKSETRKSVKDSKR